MGAYIQRVLEPADPFVQRRQPVPSPSRGKALSFSGMEVADAGVEDGIDILKQLNGSMRVISPYQYSQCGAAVVVGCLPSSDLMLDGVPFMEVRPGVRAVGPGIQSQIVQTVKASVSNLVEISCPSQRLCSA